MIARFIHVLYFEIVRVNSYSYCVLSDVMDYYYISYCVLLQEPRQYNGSQLPTFSQVHSHFLYRMSRSQELIGVLLSGIVSISFICTKRSPNYRIEIKASHALFNRYEPSVLLFLALIASGSSASLVWTLKDDISFNGLIKSTVLTARFGATFITGLASSLALYRLSPWHPLAVYPGPPLAKVVVIFVRLFRLDRRDLRCRVKAQTRAAR